MVLSLRILYCNENEISVSMNNFFLCFVALSAAQFIAKIKFAFLSLYLLKSDYYQVKCFDMIVFFRVEFTVRCGIIRGRPVTISLHKLQ